MARVSSTSVASGSTLNQDVLCAGNEWLSVIGVVGTAAAAAGAAGDVSVVVLPYLDDNPGGASAPTLVPATLFLPTTESAAAVLASSRAWVFGRYRLAGIDRVQIQVKNNNASAKPVEVNFNTG